MIVGAQHSNEVVVYYGSADGLDSSRVWTMTGEGEFGCSVSIVNDVRGGYVHAFSISHKISRVFRDDSASRTP